MNQFFPSKLKKNLLELLFSRLTISEDRAYEASYPSKASAMIRFLVENGCVDESELRTFGHYFLMRIGKELYDRHVQHGISPDQLPSPQILGYWLLHGGGEDFEFLKRQSIVFSGSETIEEYKITGLGFLDKFLEEILAGTVPFLRYQSHNTPSK